MNLHILTFWFICWTGPTGERPAFKEEDRALFLEICGIRQLSSCVKNEAQTESLRPSPAMQEMVRSVVPYIQRFLYHREDLSDVYSELQENNIAEKIKKLSFRQVRRSFPSRFDLLFGFEKLECKWLPFLVQVGKLYIRYQLDVPDSDSIVELEDVICLLKDQKELYIQKDHLFAKLDICRFVSEARPDLCQCTNKKEQITPTCTKINRYQQDSLIPNMFMKRGL